MIDDRPLAVALLGCTFKLDDNAIISAHPIPDHIIRIVVNKFLLHYKS